MYKHNRELFVQARSLSDFSYAIRMGARHARKSKMQVCECNDEVQRYMIYIYIIDIYRDSSNEAVCSLR